MVTIAILFETHVGHVCNSVNGHFNGNDGDMEKKNGSQTCLKCPGVENGKVNGRLFKK